MMPDDELWPPDWDAWAYHDFQYDQTFHVAKLKMGNSLEEFIENSQKYQYRLLKFAIESYRRDPRMTGVFQFMFMDPWPSITWSVIDYWRNPKKGYKALQIGFQPVLISLLHGRDQFVEGARDAFLLHDIMVINDLSSDFVGAELHVQLEDEDGRLRLEERHPVDIPANGRVKVVTPMLREGRWRLAEDTPAGRYILRGEIVHAGEVISMNEEIFTVYARGNNNE